MSMGNQSAYSQYAIISMANEYFYNFKDAQANFGFAIMLTLTSNLMGVGLAGIFRIFLVYPVELVNLTQLPQLRLCKALVEPEPKERIHGWTLSSMGMFWISFIVFFCWYWITDYVFLFLSTFDWKVNPNDPHLMNVTGVYQAAMGYTPLGCLDPVLTQMSPMYTPFYATFMQWFGMMLSGLVIIGMFYQNISYTGYITINDPSLYDRFGETYNISRILNEDQLFDEEKFLDYSLPYWSAGNVVAYGAFFAGYPATIVYSILEYGGLLWKCFILFGKILARKSEGLTWFNDRFSRA